MARVSLKSLSYAPDPDGRRRAGIHKEPGFSDLSLDLEHGKIFGLLGDRASGAKALFDVMAGHAFPQLGQVLFDGFDATLRDPFHRGVAVVERDPVIYPFMTVFDNIAFPLRNRQVKPVDVMLRVREVSDFVRLTVPETTSAESLSPAARAHVALARAYTRENLNLLLFDDPFGACNAVERSELQRGLRRIHREMPETILYFAEDPSAVLSLCDEIFVMHDGQIVQRGTPFELFDRPTHLTVGSLIGEPAMNVIDARVEMGAVWVGPHLIETEGSVRVSDGSAQIGIRPDYVNLTDEGIPGFVLSTHPLGRHMEVHVQMETGGPSVCALIEGRAPIPGDAVHVALQPDHTRIYRRGAIVSEPLT